MNAVGFCSSCVTALAGSVSRRMRRSVADSHACVGGSARRRSPVCASRHVRGSIRERSVKRGYSGAQKSTGGIWRPAAPCAHFAPGHLLPNRSVLIRRLMVYLKKRSVDRLDVFPPSPPGELPDWPSPSRPCGGVYLIDRRTRNIYPESKRFDSEELNYI